MAREPSSRPPSAAALARLLRAPTPTGPATRPLPAVGTGPARSRRRGLLVALVLVVAALAALPALAGGLLPWLGERTQPPFAVISPSTGTPAAPGDQAAGGQAAGEADQADPPAGFDPGAGDDHDREDDDSSGSGSGRSGGGGSSGPG